MQDIINKIKTAERQFNYFEYKETTAISQDDKRRYEYYKFLAKADLEGRKLLLQHYIEVASLLTKKGI